MRFADLNILIPAVAVPLLLALFLTRSRVMERKAIRSFAGEKLLPDVAPGYSMRTSVLRACCDIAAVLLMILALAKPQWGFEWKEDSKKGLDILFAIDTSKSMMAADISPTRLDFAKTELRRFVKRLSGDRTGLIAFAGEAFLQCPLTVDHSGFILALESLNIDTIPIGGTSISSAIEEAIRSLKTASTKNKALVLITDGENTAGDIEKALDEAKKEKIMISTVGIGTKEGEKIKLKDDKGNPLFVKNKKGEVVESRLMEDTLLMVAERTGGIYVRAKRDDLGFDDIYDKRLSHFEKGKTEDKKVKVFKERFQIPLEAAFLLLCIELAIRGRAGSRRKKTGDGVEFIQA